MSELIDSLVQNPVPATILFMWSIIMVYLIAVFLGLLVEVITGKNNHND